MGLNTGAHVISILRRQISLCRIANAFLVFIGATSCVVAGERGIVTIDGVLSRDSKPVSQLTWSDDGLIALFADPETGEHQFRQASLKARTIAWESARCDARSVPGRRGHCWDVRRSDSGLLTIRTRDGNLKLTVAGSERRYQGRAYASRSWAPPSSAWSPDLSHLVVVEQYIRLDPSQRQPTIVNGIPIIDVGEEARGVTFTEVFVIDAVNLRTVSVQTLEGEVVGIDWSKKNRLAVTHMEPERNRTELLVAEPNGFDLKQVYASSGRFQSATPAFSPDGNLVALAIDADNRNWSDFQSLIMVDVKTGHERRLTFNQPILGNDYVWSPDGTQIYARVRGGGLDTIWTFPLRGSPRQMVGGERRNHSISLSPDGRFLAFRTEDGYGRKDARVIDVRKLEERVVHVEDDPTKDYSLGRWEHFRWKSTDNVEPFGFAFYPRDFDASKTYPMIVDVHGGGPGSRLGLSAPLTRANADGPLEWHGWAAMGYVVFVPDYRSTGEYGPAIITKRLREGAFDALDDAEDVISGVEHMISRSFIDPKRIALIGHSAGGRRVFMALRQRGDLFAAAVFNDPIEPDPRNFTWRLLRGHLAGPGGGANLLKAHLGASIDDQPERYTTDYLFDARKFRTPVLIMMGSGGEKGGLPHDPYEMLYSILYAAGIPTRMVIYPEEGHTYSDKRAAKTAFEQVQSWFALHLGSSLERK